jgi:metal-responsive CopG/Arc/MetJ family transcriptional regulator
MIQFYQIDKEVYYMHTITLKSDDMFYDTLNDMVKNLNTTKSELIRKAVIYYKSVLEKEQLKQQIKHASLKVRDESLKISKEFDKTTDDGL